MLFDKKNMVVCFLILCVVFLCNTPLLAQFQNIRVDQAGAGDYQPNEVTLAINPINPEILAAGANITYFFGSTDAGQTWFQSNLTSSLGVWGDPCVTFDGLGNLFFGHLSGEPPISGNWIDRIVVQKSTDNGINWSDGAGVGLNRPRHEDKEWLSVDLTNSQYQNNIYMAWTEFDYYGSDNQADKSRILFSRSIDNGESWADPIIISDTEGDCIDQDNTTEGAVPTVGPNGEVYLSWAGPLGIMFDRSFDGGVTFGEDIFVVDQPFGWDYAVPGIYRCNGMPITICDVSDSPHRGTIYINWSDQRNGDTNTDIFLIKSTDGGDNWSDVIKVNNDNTQRHQFLTWMAIDQTNGYIYIIFYDRRNTTESDTEVYLARSKDGGDTFENFLISDNPFSPVRDIFFGDYTNIAADNGKIYPIWMELDNQEMSIWISPIDDSELITGIDEIEPTSITEFKLMQNYPNPFNPTTTISYQVLVETFVSLKVYDILGNEISTLVNEVKQNGFYEVNFDASELTSGIYLYILSTGKFQKTGKMILLR